MSWRIRWHSAVKGYVVYRGYGTIGAGCGTFLKFVHSIVTQIVWVSFVCGCFVFPLWPLGLLVLWRVRADAVGMGAWRRGRLCGVCGWGRVSCFLVVLGVGGEWGGWLSMLGANFNGVRVSFAYSIFISSRRSEMSPACHCLCHALSFAVTCSSCCGSRFDAHVMFLVGNYYSRRSLFASRFTFVAHSLFRIWNYYSRRVCFTVCF